MRVLIQQAAVLLISASVDISLMVILDEYVFHPG